MSLWNKIVLCTKFVFGGFESATDYILNLLNEFLCNVNIAERVNKIRDFAETAVTYLRKYEKYCPAVWASDYAKLMGVVQTLVDILEDGKVSSEELEKAIAAVKDAIEEWKK